MSKNVVVVFLLLAFFALSCSLERTSPSEPSLQQTLPGRASTQTHLWGYWTIYIDIPTQTVTAVLDRHAMFTVNVVNFLNTKPPKLSFHINAVHPESNYTDVDIDVGLTHPFAGMTQYNGYDVRGVFMGNGSASLLYNPDLKYPLLGVDQMMLPDPVDGAGGPDG